MRRVLFSALLLAGAAALGGCDDSFDPSRDARVRVVNASPDAPGMDVLVDDGNFASDVQFRDATAHETVEGGQRQIVVREAGNENNPPVIDLTQSLAVGVDYTIVAVGFLATLQPLVLQDDRIEPASGQAKLRLVHAAPSAPAVDIYVTAPGEDITNLTPTVSGVTFAQATSYFTLAEGSYQVRFTVAATKQVAIDSGTLELSGGDIRTILAVDAPGGGQPFAVVVLDDRD